MLEDLHQEDISWLIDLSRRAHGESRYASWPFSEAQVRKAYEEAIVPDAYCKRYERHGETAGVFLGGTSLMQFSSQTIAAEKFFWVRPESRGSAIGPVLINGFLKWAEERSLPVFITPHFGGNNSNAYSVLEKLGMRESGRIYSKGV